MRSPASLELSLSISWRSSDHDSTPGRPHTPAVDLVGLRVVLIRVNHHGSFGLLDHGGNDSRFGVLDHGREDIRSGVVDNGRGPIPSHT
jgi:hypothetical protein